MATRRIAQKYALEFSAELDKLPEALGRGLGANWKRARKIH